jgi:hypothetical protein
MVITMATIVILLFLFNRMMNVISMMDSFDTNVISTQGRTIIPQYMETVAFYCDCMMNITADKHYFLINGSDHSSCAELQRTLFYGGSSGMDDGLFDTACPQPHLIGRPFQH